jgi:hypothetical protein
MSFQRQVRRLRYGEPIVVVSGLPRSGTSMAMRMLEAGGLQLVIDRVRVADEDNPGGYFEDERVKDLARNQDRDWLRAGRGNAIKIISMLLEHLPDSNNYKVLFMNRNLQEVLASQSEMLKRRGETSETNNDDMQEAFLSHLQRAKANLRQRACFAVCELEYQDVVANPRDNAERIRRFVGKGLDVTSMVAAVDPALHRNRF